MPTVSHIGTDKYGKIRQVRLDGEPWLAVYGKRLRELSLTEGLELTVERADELERECALVDAVRYCVNVLDRRGHSEHQLREKVRKRGFSERAADIAMERLGELLLLDDAGYASSVVNMGLASRHGRSRIARKLTEAGISAEVAEAALAELGDDDDDLERCKDLIQRRSYDLGDPAAQRKAMGFLLRRGYAPNIIFRSFNELKAGV